LKGAWCVCGVATKKQSPVPLLCACVVAFCVSLLWFWRPPIFAYWHTRYRVLMLCDTFLELARACQEGRRVRERGHEE
jgi:hypothetical protein